ncbi:MAG: ribulose-phosphate 3-epimerase [Candidatus Omnitrophota bacterium]
MPKPIQVSASILCANFAKLGDEIKRCEDAGVDALHVDVMDGHFVPNITIGPLIVETIRPLTKLPIESHLMIENPSMYIDDFLNAGSDIISIQVECYGPLKEASKGLGKFPKEIESLNEDLIRKDIVKIRTKGKKVFLVINPGTPLCIENLLKDIDGVLLMSVNPGFAKQKFMPVALPKAEALRKVFSKDIAIDGGINAETAPLAVKAGVNILATASYLFGAKDPKVAVKYLKSLK